LFHDPVNFQNSGFGGSKYIIHLSKNLVSKKAISSKYVQKIKSTIFAQIHQWAD